MFSFHILDTVAANCTSKIGCYFIFHFTSSIEKYIWHKSNQEVVQCLLLFKLSGFLGLLLLAAYGRRNHLSPVTNGRQESHRQETSMIRIPNWHMRKDHTELKREKDARSSHGSSIHCLSTPLALVRFYPAKSSAWTPKTNPLRVPMIVVHLNCQSLAWLVA